MGKRKLTEDEQNIRRKMLALKLYQVESYAIDTQLVVDCIELMLDQWCFNDSDMAFVLGIPKSKFSELRNQKREPSKTEIAKMAAIGFPVASFFESGGQND